jgi:hypothetical protein
MRGRRSGSKGEEGDGGRVYRKDSIHVHVCKEEEGDVARGWTE